MSNENNEGIIIEGGITEITFNKHGMFPITVPVQEIKVYGNNVTKEHGIPTMDGFIIFIGMNAQTKHGGRIKVMRSSENDKRFRDHKLYDEFYYKDGEVKRESSDKSSKTKFSKKELKQIEDFFIRNKTDILLNSNNTPSSKRISDDELFNRIFKTEMEYYKNGGR